MRRVYQFGLRAPTDGADLVRDQLRAAHAYRNDLVAIERGRRFALRAIDGTPEVRGAVEVVRAATKSTRKAAVTKLREARKLSRAAATDELARIQEREHQIRTDARAITHAYWGCVDDETEILTEHGWRTHAQFVGTERVATVSLVSGQMEWQVAIGKTEGLYDGPMAQIKTARLDMLLTPNHRVVWKSVYDHALRVSTVDEMLEKAPSTKIRILQAAPGLSTLGHALDVSPAMASVLGWIIAEGYFHKRQNAVSISQSEAMNAPYCDMIRSALRASMLEWREHKQTRGMICFYIPARGGHGARIRSLIPDKLLTPSLVFGLSDDAARALFQALLLGDGSRSVTSTGKPRWRWDQVNRTNIALFQALALRLGFATHAHLSPSRMHCTRISVRNQSYAAWSRKPTIVGYKGVVWCACTPNSTWVARRHGTVFVTGNSYLDIEAAHNQARSAPLYDDDAITPSDPRFSRWDGEGQIGIQLQGGLSTADAQAGDDTRVRLVDAGHHTSSKRFATLWLRVGSEGRAPMWAQFPVMVHREIPSSAIWKWVRVSLRREAFREVWTVEITVDDSAPHPHSRDASLRDAVAVEWEWSPLDDGGMRVGRWADTRGQTGMIELSAHDVAGIRKGDGIRSVRDTVRADASERIARTLVETREPLPAWLADAARTMHLWKSSDRYHALVLRWRRERCDAARKAYELLDAWAMRDAHLYEYEVGARRGALRRRRERYRVIASEWAGRYRTVLLSDQDLSREARFGDDSDRRFTAGCSELRAALRNAFGEEDAVESRWRDQPGEEEDREWCERTRDAWTAGGARGDGRFSELKTKTGNAWAARKAKGAARRAETEAAREAVGKCAE